MGDESRMAFPVQHILQTVGSQFGELKTKPMNSTALIAQRSPIEGVVLSLPDSDNHAHCSTDGYRPPDANNYVRHVATSARTDGGIENEKQLNSVPDLPVELAVIEVLEYIILSCANGVRGSKLGMPEVHVKIITLGELTKEDHCFQVKVSGTCSRLEQFDVNTFLQGHATCLLKLVREMEAGYNGGHLWTDMPVATQSGVQNLTTTWLLKGNTHATPSKQDYKENSPYVKIVFRLMQTKRHVVSECEELETYMRRMQLANPHVNLTLSLNLGAVKTVTEFRGRLEDSQTDRWKPLLDITQYMSVDGYGGDAQQLQLRMSSPCKLSGGLRLTVGASLIPPLGTGDIIHSTDCSSVQVLVYGPGRLPLMVPGLKVSALHTAVWLSLQNFGLKLGQQVEPPRTPGVVRADCRYELLPTDDKNAEERDPSCLTYTFQIFVFIDPEDENEANASTTLCSNDQLRQVLSGMFSKYRSKLEKGTSLAVSKLLKNRLVDQQRQKWMEKVIPSICSSLSDVVRRSTSDNFRSSAFASHQVDDSRSLYEAMGTKLWDIAEDKFGVHRRENQEVRPRISGPKHKGKSSTQAEPTKKRKQRHCDSDLPCKKARTEQDTLCRLSSAGSADCSPPIEVPSTSSQGQRHGQGRTKQRRRAVPSSLGKSVDCTPSEDVPSTSAQCHGHGQAQSEGRHPAVTSVYPSETVMGSQDLESFDLLGLDLVPDDLQLDPVLAKGVLGDIVDPNSGPYELSLAPEGHDQQQPTDHFDLFSHCEPGVEVFDDDWLGDLLSIL